ncbi:MAG TPA: hypothetical protein VID51_04475 [Solirubrobacterales bacterium]
MRGRASGVVGAMLALFALPSSVAVATTTLPGPRLAIVAQSGATLITVGPGGEMPEDLAIRPLSRFERIASSHPSWSADGGLLALSISGDEGQAVGVARADGGGLRVFHRASLEGGDPVIAPDGHSVAFSRAKLVKVLPGRENYLFKSAIWLLDVKSGSVRRLTRWRLSTYLTPSSFSPDGSMLATSMFSRQGFRAVAIDLKSGDFSLLAREALEPTYSPDGSHFAFVRYLNWRLNGINEKVPAADELRVGRVGSVTGTRLLLRRRGFFAWPSWDTSGQRLAFTHSPADEIGDRTPDPGDRVMEINADGTCLRTVLSDPGLTLFGAAWQPGVGREAGPIVC